MEESYFDNLFVINENKKENKNTEYELIYDKNEDNQNIKVKTDYIEQSPTKVKKENLTDLLAKFSVGDIVKETKDNIPNYISNIRKEVKTENQQYIEKMKKMERFLWSTDKDHLPFDDMSIGKSGNNLQSELDQINYEIAKNEANIYRIDLSRGSLSCQLSSLKDSLQIVKNIQIADGFVSSYDCEFIRTTIGKTLKSLDFSTVILTNKIANIQVTSSLCSSRSASSNLNNSFSSSPITLSSSPLANTACVQTTYNPIENKTQNLLSTNLAQLNKFTTDQETISFEDYTEEEEEEKEEKEKEIIKDSEVNVSSFIIYKADAVKPDNFINNQLSKEDDSIIDIKKIEKEKIKEKKRIIRSHKRLIRNLDMLSTTHNYDNINSIISAVSNDESLTTDSLEEVENILFERAFYGCSGLKKVILPETLQRIEPGAFMDCTNLINITIPQSVVSIGTFTFANCYSLVAITLPSHIEAVDSYTFLGCARLSYVLLQGKDVTLYHNSFENCSALEMVEALKGIKRIDEKAFFNCKSLKEIKTNNSKKVILSNGIFSKCPKLRQGFIMDNIQILKIEVTETITIENVIKNQFSDKAIDYLEMLIISGTIKLEDCEFIKKFMSLRYLDLSSAKFAENVIPKEAFKGTRNIVCLILPDEITIIGEGAFRDCVNLTTVWLPKSLEMIESHAFNGCILLNDIAISDLVNLTEILPYSFANCKSLTCFNFPNNGKLKAVENNLFFRCFELKNVHLPEELESIGRYSFFACHSLSNIQIPKNTRYIGDHAFYGCGSLTEITIPNGVSEINEQTFLSCTALNKITFPKSLIAINDSAFAGCSTLYDITIPNNVGILGSGVFGSCISLEKCNIPRQLKKIPPLLFNDCISLKKVEIPQRTGLLFEIGESAFQGCISLIELKLPETIRNINTNAFANCSKLELINISPNIEIIAEDAFEGCVELRKIMLPKGLKYKQKKYIGGDKKAK